MPHPVRLARPTPDAPGSPWHTQSSQVVYRNPWITVTEFQVTRPDGQPGIYGVVDPGDNVTIAAVDEDGHVWMIEDFVYPIQRRAWVLPSGGVEPNEDPLLAAQRELREETGVSAARWEELGSFYLSPGILPQRSHIYLARDLTIGEPQREGSEQTMIARAVPLTEAYNSCEHASATEAVSVVTALGILLARAHVS